MTNLSILSSTSCYIAHDCRFATPRSEGLVVRGIELATDEIRFARHVRYLEYLYDLVLARFIHQRIYYVEIERMHSLVPRQH
jgi:hypothetical protein